MYAQRCRVSCLCSDVVVDDAARQRAAQRERASCPDGRGGREADYPQGGASYAPALLSVVGNPRFPTGWCDNHCSVLKLGEVLG